MAKIESKSFKFNGRSFHMPSPSRPFGLQTKVEVNLAKIALKSLISLGCARTKDTRTTKKSADRQKGQIEAKT